MFQIKTVIAQYMMDNASRDSIKKDGMLMMENAK